MKRGLCVLLCILLLMPGLVFADTAKTELKYPDIAGNKYESQLREWIGFSFITGYLDGTFRPENKITRAEFMALTNRSFGFTDTMDIKFSDADSKQWFYKDAAKAVKAGFIQGANGKLMPLDNISRQEMAVILTRLTKNEKTALDEAALKNLTDYQSIPGWSKQAISLSLKKGYFEGFIDKSFKPAEKVSRLEAVVALDRALKGMFKAVYTSKGTYGPETGMQVVEGDVLVLAPEVTLKNTTINGNLILRETLGEGNVSLDNVVVKGTTVVKGGGPNSIVVKNSTLNKVRIIKEGSTVRIVATGSTSIGTVEVGADTRLKETQLTGTGFNDVVILDDIPAGAKVIFEGDFEDVQIDSSNIHVAVESGSIKQMMLSKEAEDTNIDISQGTKVTTLTLNAAAKVTGKGTIDVANINATGTVMEQKPNKVVIAPKVIAQIAGSTVTETQNPVPSYGGGGGGGGYYTPANSAPTATNVKITGQAAAGQLLTGSYTYNDTENNPEGTSTFKWYRASSASGTKEVISGATAKTYTVQKADADKYLFFEVTPVASAGTTTGTAVMSAATAKVESLHTDATLKDLKVAGTKVTGFNAATLAYTVYLPAGTTVVPAVTAAVNDTGKATLAVTPAANLPGDTIVTVTAQDGTTKKVYTIHFTVIPDKSALQAAIAAAEAKQQDLYTPESWSAMQTALELAVEVNSNTMATAAQIAEATTALQNKLAALVLKSAANVLEIIPALGSSTVVQGNALTPSETVLSSNYDAAGLKTFVTLKQGTAIVNFNDIFSSFKLATKVGEGAYAGPYEMNGAYSTFQYGPAGGYSVSAGIAQTTKLTGAVKESAPAGVYTITTEVKDGETVTASAVYTLTITEKPVVTEADASNLTELKAALANTSITTIHLTADFSTAEKILIDRAVAIHGNGHKITFTGNPAGWQGNYVIQIYKTEGVAIHDIKLTGGDGALLVNGSEVTLRGAIDVSGNEFGGIEVSKGQGVTADPVLTVNNAAFTNTTEAYGLPTIWEDGVADCVAGFIGLKVIKGTQIQYYLVELNAVDAKIISTSEELKAAILGQQKGQTWYIKNGQYNLERFDTLTAGGQTGWYFPVMADDLTIMGESKEGTIITSDVQSANGNWSSQDHISVWGNNITIKNITVKPKIETNKAIEVMGKNFRLINVNFVQRENQIDSFAGSLYFNPQNETKDIGNALVDTLLVNDAWISCSTSAVKAGTLTIKNTTIDFRGSAYAEDDAYGVISSNPLISVVEGSPLTVLVDSSIANLQKQVLDRVPAGTVVILEAGTYRVPAPLTIPAGVTLDKETNGAVIDEIPAGTVYVKNTTELDAALKGNATTIYLAAGTYKLDSQIRITRAINLIGAGDNTIITKGSTPWTNATGSKGYASLIAIYSGAQPVRIEGVKVSGAANIAMTAPGSGIDYGSGINVISSSDVVLSNVTSTDNAAAGLIVNSSSVTADHLNTAGNAWYGINVDQADSGAASLTIRDSLLAEDIEILSDKTANVTVDAAGYTAYPLEGTTKTIWNTKPLKNVASITRGGSTKVYPTLQAAAAVSQEGDTIQLAAGTFGITATIQLNKANVTVQGAGSSLTHITAPPQTAGYAFHITGAGVKLQGIQLEKTDKTGIHNLILINADDVVIKDNVIFGRFDLKDGDVSRAMEIAGGKTGILIEGNTIYNLRQPAYINASEGRIIENNVYGTKGWVIDGAKMTFENNTWGTAPNLNVTDIALLKGTTLGAPYSDLTALSAANHGARIEDQRINTNNIYVKAGAVDGEGSPTKPLASIQAGINAVAANGTVHVAAGVYTEDVNVNKTITILGAGAETTKLVGTTGNTTPLTFSAKDATVKGFTITHSYTPAELTAWSFNNNGVAFGQSTSGNTLTECVVSLNRNGVYLNNSQNNHIINNIITNNRTGINLTNNVNQTDITGNTLSNNWTLGLVYYSLGTATDFSTVTVSGNTFDQNWYTEVLIKDAASCTGTLNVTDNTFTDDPVTYTTSADSSLNEPGFSSQKPKVEGIGGTEEKPGKDLPTLRIYNSGSVQLLYGPKTLMVGPQEPYKTLQTAIDAAQSGDTILAAAGTYSANQFLVLAAKAGITIQGAGTDQTIFELTAKNDGFKVQADNVTLKDFQINTLSGEGKAYYGLRAQGVSNLRVENVKIINMAKSAFDINGVADSSFTGLQAANNGGYGIAINQCKNVSFSGRTDGNSWGAVLVANKVQPFANTETSGIHIQNVVSTELIRLNVENYIAEAKLVEGITYDHDTIADTAIVTSEPGLIRYTFLAKNAVPEVTLDASKITVHNNGGGLDDYVEVSNMSQGDIIKVYTAVGGTAVGTGIIGADGSCSIVMPNVLGKPAGSIWATATRGGVEGTAVEKPYHAELEAPTNVNVVSSDTQPGAAGGIENVITWTESPSEAATVYFVVRQNTAAPEVFDYIASNIPAGTRAYVDATPVAGTTYVYFIQCGDGNQNFTQSAGFTITTAAEAEVQVGESLTSNTLTRFDYSTKMTPVQARLMSKTIETTNFKSNPKTFVIDDHQGNVITVTLNWDIPVTPPFNRAAVVGSAVESTIQDYFYKKNGAEGIMNRSIYATVVPSSNGYGDQFYIGTFGTGAGSSISVSGADAAYFFDTLQASGIVEDASANRSFTISDGTNTALIQLNGNLGSIEGLIGRINSLLTQYGIQATAEKVDAGHFKLIANQPGIHLTVDGPDKAVFFSSFTSQ